MSYRGKSYIDTKYRVISILLLRIKRDVIITYVIVSNGHEFNY